jgi:hypothetical protein
MPHTSIARLHSGNLRQPGDAPFGDPVVPWGKGLALDAIGRDAGTMECRIVSAILRRLRFAKD